MEVPYLYNRLVTPNERLGSTISYIYNRFSPKVVNIYHDSKYPGAGDDRYNCIICIITDEVFALSQIKEVEEQTGLVCHDISYHEDKSTPMRSGVSINMNYSRHRQEKWEDDHPEIITKEKVYK